jgi:starch phosphorylase
VLLGDVVPTYYDDHERWVTMMQNSIASARERFSVERMLREYEELLYNAEPALAS